MDTNIWLVGARLFAYVGLLSVLWISAVLLVRRGVNKLRHPAPAAGRPERTTRVPQLIR